MGRFLLCLLSVLLPTTSGLLVAQSKPCRSTVVGDLRVQTLASKTFDDTHTLRVWLPPGYDDVVNAKKVYPVLYLLDGQNLFDACTSAFGHEWEIDESLTRLIGERSVEPLVVVGIDNAGVQRADQYIPFPDAVFGPWNAPYPHGNLFPNFLIDEVIPAVAARYRVSAERLHRGIGGSSYGGVAALYTLLKRPDVFGLGLIESASLQVGNGELLRMSTLLMLGPHKVYVGVGGKETAGGDGLARRLGIGLGDGDVGFAASSERLAANLKLAILNHPQVLFVEAPEAMHQEQAWAARFPRAVEFLFPTAKQR